MAYSYNLRNRCPGCNGFAGAYVKKGTFLHEDGSRHPYKDNKRCRGFRHQDGGYFCEVPNEGKGFNFTGHYSLWYYKDQDDPS